ncbi:MAG: single-stranded DNA-binding protein [Bacilli bacterium]
MNKVILLGRLVKDPKVSSTSNGTSVCRFSIAVQRRYAKEGEERKADFINCVAWRQQAEFIGKYFAKGQRILVEGALQSRTWEDNESKKRYSMDVIVESVSFVDYKKEQSEVDPLDELAELAGIIDEDLPF